MSVECEICGNDGDLCNCPPGTVCIYVHNKSLIGIVGQTIIQGDQAHMIEQVKYVPMSAYETAIKERDEARAERNLAQEHPCDTCKDKLTAERAKSQRLVEAADRIMRNPKYTSQIAIAAWEQALAAYSKDKGE